WPSYWAALFARQGFYPDLSYRLRIWPDRFIDPLLRQTGLLYVKRSARFKPSYSLEALDLVHPAIYKTLPYKPADIQPVAMLGQLPNVLMVNPESGINSVADLVARAKAKPNILNYASNGNGTSLHLSAELLKSQAGVQIVHVPYRGTALANVALMSKEIDLMFDNLPPALPHIQSGKLKALAVTTSKRNPALPNVPTMQELGYPKFVVSGWFGLAVVRGTSAELTEKLQDALRKVIAQEDVATAITARGVSIEFMNAAQMDGFMKTDAERWQQVASFANIKLD
ncbi:MAG: tripartite tricarboxylate transporter substrate binding protein, partial [Betaproteobacteria bacterium]|nr:tripartite tricarboxylate transporter substrate binding protein [Betaproteobacteria bacterium]